MVIIYLLLRAANTPAQQTLCEISWDQLKQQGKLTVGEVLPVDTEINTPPLKLKNPQNQPIIFDILTLDHPAITTPYIALIGKVKYEQIQGIGHLALWTFFSEEEKYFTRTVDTDGPMRQLAGSSQWRDFILPFKFDKKSQFPIKLEFKVFLPDTGSVYLCPIRLIQYENYQALNAAIGNLPVNTKGTKVWWSDTVAGWIGALIGASAGLLGALIGTLTGMGKAKFIVLASLRLLLISGLTSLGLAFIALIKSQPYAVYYPLLLFGAIGSILPLSLYRPVLKRFQQIGLRKILTMDTTTRQ